MWWSWRFRYDVQPGTVQRQPSRSKMRRSAGTFARGNLQVSKQCSSMALSASLSLAVRPFRRSIRRCTVASTVKPKQRLRFAWRHAEPFSDELGQTRTSVGSIAARPGELEQERAHLSEQPLLHAQRAAQPPVELDGFGGLHILDERHDDGGEEYRIARPERADVRARPWLVPTGVLRAPVCGSLARPCESGIDLEADGRCDLRRDDLGDTGLRQRLPGHTAGEEPRATPARADARRHMQPDGLARRVIGAILVGLHARLERARIHCTNLPRQGTRRHLLGCVEPVRLVLRSRHPA